MRSLPLVIFTLIVIGLGIALWNQRVTPQASPLLNQPLPDFTVSGLHPSDTPITASQFQNHITLLNIFASWCTGCVAEHPLLVQWQQESDVPVVGLVWKDEREKVITWLEQRGNPYDMIGVDSKSEAAIALGVAGIPETFVIDRNGIIRFHQAGPLTPQTIDELKTLFEQLRHES